MRWIYDGLNPDADYEPTLARDADGWWRATSKATPVHEVPNGTTWPLHLLPAERRRPLVAGQRRQQECHETLVVATAPVLTAPALVTAPALSGTGKIGTAVSVRAGSWSGNPAPTTSLQWRANGAAIAGATAASYTPVAADDGKD